MSADKDYNPENQKKEDLPHLEDIPPKKIPNPYLAYLKKIGFTIWLSVMVIGGVLAFITSLVLL